MYGVENRFEMLLLLGLKRPHCGMRIQQLSTTSRLRVNRRFHALPEQRDPHRQHQVRHVEHREVLSSLVRRFTVEPAKEYAKIRFPGLKHPCH